MAYRDGESRLGGRAYQETGAASAGTSASDGAIASMQRAQAARDRRAVWKFGRGLVSRDRRAIREKIETESKIRNWFQDLTSAKYLSQDLTSARRATSSNLVRHHEGYN
jgi:hypothetical protein